MNNTVCSVTTWDDHESLVIVIQCYMSYMSVVSKYESVWRQELFLTLSHFVIVFLI